MAYKVTTLIFLIRGDGDEREILLATKKRGFGEGYWNGAGGKVEPGETVEEALIRETQEEIGITPTVYSKVAEHDFRMDADTDTPWHMYVHAYIATNWDGEPTESEEMAPQWFKISDIPYTKMWQDDPLWLPQVLAGQKVVARYQFAQDHTLVTHDVTITEELPHEIPAEPEQ